MAALHLKAFVNTFALVALSLCSIFGGMHLWWHPFRRKR